MASLVCIATPPETDITGLDGDRRFALRAGDRIRIGGSRYAQVVVRSPHIAISQASLAIVVVDDSGCCRVRDSGHNFSVRVNDQIIAAPRELVDGDVIEPCLLDEPLGLRFRFESGDPAAHRAARSSPADPSR